MVVVLSSWYCSVQVSPHQRLQPMLWVWVLLPPHWPPSEWALADSCSSIVFGRVRVRVSDGISVGVSVGVRVGLVSSFGFR